MSQAFLHVNASSGEIVLLIESFSLIGVFQVFPAVGMLSMAGKVSK